MKINFFYIVSILTFALRFGFSDTVYYVGDLYTWHGNNPFVSAKGSISGDISALIKSLINNPAYNYVGLTNTADSIGDDYFNGSWNGHVTNYFTVSGSGGSFTNMANSQLFTRGWGSGEYNYGSYGYQYIFKKIDSNTVGVYAASHYQDTGSGINYSVLFADTFLGTYNLNSPITYSFNYSSSTGSPTNSTYTVLFASFDPSLTLSVPSGTISISKSITSTKAFTISVHLD